MLLSFQESSKQKQSNESAVSSSRINKVHDEGDPHHRHHFEQRKELRMFSRRMRVCFVPLLCQIQLKRNCACIYVGVDFEIGTELH